MKVEKESIRGRMDNSAGEEEIHRGTEIPSVLQILRKIAMAEGQDQDSNTNPKGTESSTLSHSKKHNYYFRQSLREWNKKQRVIPDSHDARYMTNNLVAERGELDGRLIRFNWSVQSQGAMRKIMTGGTKLLLTVMQPNWPN